MSRLASNAARHFVDILVLFGAFVVAFLVRFDGDLPYEYLKRLLFWTPYVVALQWGVLLLTGVHRFAWRYVGLREVWRIGLALGLSSAALLAARLVAGGLVKDINALQYAAVPIGVIVIDYIAAFLGIAGVRVLRRITIERRNRRDRLRKGPAQGRKVLLVGAGRAGMLVAQEIAKRPDLGLDAVGFLDDDPHKRGTVIHGVRVLGPTERLGEIARHHGAEEVVITIASAGGQVIRRIANLAEAAGVHAKIIPAIYEILDGQVNLSRIRDVQIEDLLGRDAVQLDPETVEPFVTGRKVMVTGAGGSIGSELCRQLARLGPSDLILIERAEPALFQVHRELRLAHAGLALHPVLGDVGDERLMERVFGRERPEVVFHAAAHKHVPMVEWNPGEAVKNNLFGTRALADASDRFGVEAFVLVSTDKAVNPTSVMGATKRAAEVYIQALSQRSKTKFVAVRFGNVLGSAGSVIPIFQNQIKAGGPVTVTHPEMQRYFMTIPEASQLVMQAGAMGRGGEIFVLDMGEPVKIVDLARDLIRLSGFQPGVDIPIEFTGVRPGEKLFEELSFDAERMEKTRHPKIFVGHLTPRPWDEVLPEVERLARVIDESDRFVVRDALANLVPEMQPPEDLAGDDTPEDPPAPAKGKRSRRVTAQPAVVSS